MSKSETIKIRLDVDEKSAFQQAAELSGLSLSTWIRERLRRASRIELEDARRPIPFLRRTLEGE